MSAARKAALCPRCGTELDANASGAWCPGYPCRYSINRAKVKDAARLALLIWGRGR